MAETLSMALAELLRKADAEPDLDTLREGVRVMTQALMELEVAQHLGAERYQRSPERQRERNGYRDRNWDTRVGTLDVACGAADPLVVVRSGLDHAEVAQAPSVPSVQSRVRRRDQRGQSRSRH